MPVERAAKICGLDVEDIIGATRLYATAKPSSIAWGPRYRPEGERLAGRSGHLRPHGAHRLFGRAGRHHHRRGERRPERGRLRLRLQCPRNCRRSSADWRSTRSTRASRSTANNAMALEALETGKPYPLKMGFYMGNNIIACNGAQPKRWHDAMVKSLEFCVGFRHVDHALRGRPPATSCCRFPRWPSRTAQCSRTIRHCRSSTARSPSPWNAARA